MIKKIAVSFLLAFHNIRSNFFHTILSIIGIVIGVAALVSILSFIDGLEEYARSQITQTTSLKAIIIQSNPIKRVNEVRIRKDSFAIVDFNRYQQIKKLLDGRADVQYLSTRSDEILIEGKDAPVGTIIYASGSLPKANVQVEFGRMITEDQLAKGEPVTFIDHAMLNKLVGEREEKNIVGKKLTYLDHELTIIGISKNDSNTTPHLFVPINLFSKKELLANPPNLVIEAKQVEDVPKLKDEATEFLKNNYPTYKEDFSIVTNEGRVKQAAQGFLLFRVIMGLIVGISVLVGGIGVMNVLLISVTERTTEIGIRKAVGANRSDIILQFLCESITVSTFGSLLGLIFGVLGTLGILPIIKAITKAPFQAAFTLNTLLVVSIVALAVGIIFGTYPAIRAAKLDPTEAIRRE